MVSSKCYVLGCKTGYAIDRKRRKAAGEKSLHLFSVPREKEKFEKWRKAIPRADRDLTEKDKICELHFLNEEMEKSYIIKLPNGNVHHFEKGRCVLKPHAVPSIFQNFPGSTEITEKRKYLSKSDSLPKNANTDILLQEVIHSLPASVTEISEKSKFPSKNNLTPKTENTDILLQEQMTVTNNTTVQKFIYGALSESNVQLIKSKIYVLKPGTMPSVIQILPSSVTEISRKRNSAFKSMSSSEKANTDIILQEEMIVRNDIKLEKFSFSTLLNDVNKVTKPSKLWSVSAHDDFIICAKWDTKFVPQRVIIIHDNLNVQVFYYGKEASNITEKDVKCTESVSLLMKTVDEYNICPGALSDFRNSNCDLYLEPNWNVPGRSKVWCTSCRKARNRQTSHDKLIKLNLRYKKLYKNFASVKQKNSQLKEKIANLKKKKAAFKKEFSRRKSTDIMNQIDMKKLKSHIKSGDISL